MSGGFVDVKAAMGALHDLLTGGQPLKPWADSGSGGTPNMKRFRALRPLLEHGDGGPLSAFLQEEERAGHCLIEPFSSSHGHLHCGAMGVALLKSKNALETLCVRWWQREFRLCRLFDAGAVVGPWGPGARASDGGPLLGSNMGRTLAYNAVRGIKVRPKQLQDKGNVGALALSLLPAGLRTRLLDTPAEFKLVGELRVARRGTPGAQQAGGTYVAWFPDGIPEAVDVALAAGVWDGRPFISREVDAEAQARIALCGPPVIIPAA